MLTTMYPLYFMRNTLLMYNIYFYVLHSYGSVNSDNPKAVQHFLLEVYQPVVVTSSAVCVVRSHYYQLTGLPRLINLMGAQLVYHVGTVTETPMLHLPTELINLPDDLDSLKRLPLDVSFLTRTEGMTHFSVTVQYSIYIVTQLIVFIC